MIDPSFQVAGRQAIAAHAAHGPRLQYIYDEGASRAASAARLVPQVQVLAFIVTLFVVS